MHTLSSPWNKSIRSIVCHPLRGRRPFPALLAVGQPLSTSIQDLIFKYNAKQDNGAIPISEIRNLKNEMTDVVATSSKDVEGIADITTLMLKLPQNEKRAALDPLLRNLSSRWSGRDTMTLSQSLRCLSVLRDYRVHDTKADLLIGLINKELIIYLGVEDVWSLDDIASALQSVAHMNRNTVNMKQLLSLVTKHLTRNEFATAPGPVVFEILSALRHKYGGLLIDGREGCTICDTTDILLATLPRIIDGCDDYLSVNELLTVLAHFSNLDTNQQLQTRLLESVERQLLASYNDNFFQRYYNEHCSGRVITMAIRGFKNMNCKHEVVPRLLRILKPILVDTKVGFTMNLLLSSINGMRCMNSTVPEVRHLVSAITRKIVVARKFDTNVVPECARLAVAGLQNMSSDTREVRHLLDAISPYVVRHLDRSAFAECLYYLRNMRLKHAQSVYDVLLSYCVNFTESPQDFVQANWKDSSVDTFSEDVARYIRMGKHDLLKSLKGKHKEELEKFMIHLYQTVPMVKAFEEFRSVHEKQFYNTLKRELYMKKNIQIRGSSSLLAFEADVVLTAIDEATGQVHLIINVELDISDQHTNHLRVENCKMRDNYLFQEHGIVVLRLTRDQVRQAKTRGTVLSIIDAAERDPTLVEKQIVARIKMLLQ